MVQGVFDLSHTRAKEIMVPRVNVVAVDVSASLEAVLDTCADRRVTRLPVYDGTLDQVVGIADIRDVERAIRQGLSLEDVLTEPLQVPDTIEIDDLLSEMQAERVSMAVVRDEFGEVEGVLTVEDILEEIVGEIFEVGEERLVRPTADGLLVNGEATVDEVNDALGTAVPTAGDFETVAGLVNAELGRLGDVGDRIEIDGVQFTVESIDGTRIRRVRVRRLSDVPKSDAGPSDADGPP
jgi:CBS domain containing-hemolysin-like protein